MNLFHNDSLNRIRTTERGCVLLSGPMGLYQYDDALILAEKALGDKINGHPDFVMYRAKERTLNVEVIEEITTKLRLLPGKASRYVVVIEGAETFNDAAQNKFLKVLEEGEAFFILISYGEMLSTITSRSVVIPYRPYSLEKFQELSGKDETAYYISGGCPEQTAEEGLEEIFDTVGASFVAGDVKKVLSILNLVKEKDKNSFFECYRTYVPALFAYLGRLLQQNNGNYEKISKAAECSIYSSKQSYVSADFFKDVVILLPEKR